ncbi:pilus assembly protein TadG-related protein [Actinomycetota bacterium]
MSGGRVVAASPPRRRGRPAPDAESGQIGLLLLGLTMVAITLILVTAAITSAHLTRMRLLDAADGAALDAADSLDTSIYTGGLREAVALSNNSVAEAASNYLAARPVPPSMLAWAVAPGTGSPDGQTAVVRVTGTAEVPFVGALLEAAGTTITITVESRARADLQQ